jgi:hypothetical protein
MSRRQKDPLRAVTAEERRFLERLSRSSSQPSIHVTRAKASARATTGIRKPAHLFLPAHLRDTSTVVIALPSFSASARNPPIMLLLRDPKA